MPTTEQEALEKFYGGEIPEGVETDSWTAPVIQNESIDVDSQLGLTPPGQKSIWHPGLHVVNGLAAGTMSKTHVSPPPRPAPVARQPSSSAKKRRRTKLLTTKKKPRKSVVSHFSAPAPPPTPSVFDCPSCKKPFSSEKRLQGHQQLFCGGSCANPAVHVDPTRPFMCNACGYRFKRKDTLEKHVQNVHAKPKANSRGFGGANSAGTALGGMKLQQSAMGMECTPCGMVFTDGGAAFSHYLEKHNGKAQK